MKTRKTGRALSAILAAVLLLAAVFAASAESGDPFAVPAAQPAPTADPFGASGAQEGAGGFAAAGDPEAPEPTPTAYVDLFNLGTPTPGPEIGTAYGSDPFAEGAAPSNGQIMYVTATGTKIRRQPSKNAAVLTTAAFGQELTVTAIQGDWARVQSGSRTGYCRVSDLSGLNPNTLSRMMFAQLSRVPVYAAPSTKAKKLSWLSLGDTITVVAISTDGMWSRVTDGSRFGFVPTLCLDEAPASKGTPMWCADSAADVFVNPDNWVRVTGLKLGQKVHLLGYVSGNTMAKIRTGKGYVAYCAASALTASNPISLNRTVYTQVSGRILYRSPSSGAKTANINKNARMTLVGLDSSQYWAVVQFKGKTYYAPNLLLDTARLGKGYRILAAGADVTLYKNGGQAAGTLPAGTRMYLVGFSGGKASVVTIADGTNPQQRGYVSLRDLKSE